jgi:hypothetical protein
MRTTIGTETASLFETGQYGDLFIVSGVSEEGWVLYIQVLPTGEQAILPSDSGFSVHHPFDYVSKLCINKDAVLVFGKISEDDEFAWYNWIHEGPWVDDFHVLTEMLKNRKAQEVDALNKAFEERRLRDLYILSKYESRSHANLSIIVDEKIRQQGYYEYSLNGLMDRAYTECKQ